MNKLSFGGSPLHCIPTCALGEKKKKKRRRMGIKGREDEEGMEKGDGVREKRHERMMERGIRSRGDVPQQTHMTCSHSLVMSFRMTVI